MRRLVVVALMCVSLGLSAAEVPATEHVGAGEALGANIDMDQTMSTVGAGLLGMLVASGAVGMISATTMMLEGTGVTDALEAGANLPMPLAVLSAVIGGVFAQEFVQRNIKSFNWGETKAHVAAH